MATTALPDFLLTVNLPSTLLAQEIPSTREEEITSRCNITFRPSFVRSAACVSANDGFMSCYLISYPFNILPTERPTKPIIHYQKAIAPYAHNPHQQMLSKSPLPRKKVPSGKYQKKTKKKSVVAPTQ
ncbi:MAG: hypothetical protein RAO75_08730 [Candidatus Chlorobium antarcticum]|nr:hypothetical protein [Candidatus Chlorobium antarcticum]